MTHRKHCRSQTLMFRAGIVSHREQLLEMKLSPAYFWKFTSPTHPKLTKQLLCFQGSVVPASQWCETHTQGQQSRAGSVAMDTLHPVPGSPSWWKWKGTLHEGGATVTKCNCDNNLLATFPHSRETWLRLPAREQWSAFKDCWSNCSFSTVVSFKECH